MDTPRRSRRAPSRIVVALALALAWASPAAGEGYLSALEDVPLMPGFAEVSEGGMSFEAATGRIVEATATGIRRPGTDRAAVLAFYADALPALGWRAEGVGRFVREGEALTVAVEETAAVLTVRFALKPR